VKPVLRHTPSRPPALYNGDRLTQPEFHQRYEASPEDFRAELIGGIVYVASPLRRTHGSYHPKLGTVLCLYESATPRVEALDNATLILGEESEPQADLMLRVLLEFGGRTRTTAGDYVAGAPELVAEVAHSTLEIDLHRKKDDYAQAGVLEYFVLCLAEREVGWFNIEEGGVIRADARGVLRSGVCPGLWVDGKALLAGDVSRLVATARRGLASRARAGFVKRLRAGRRG
jgi:hypothetical protein